jgi:ribosomal protein L21E
MKIGDVVEVAWSLPQYAPSYNGQRGVVANIANSGFIVHVSLGKKGCLPMPIECAKVITVLDQLAEIQ